MFMLWPFKIALKVIEAIFSAMVIYLVVSAVQVVMASSLPQAATAFTPASAIVMIGSAASNNAASPDLQARIDEAVALYDAHLATKILVTGTAAIGGPNIPDSEVALLEQRSVPKAAITAVVGGNTAAQLSQVASTLGPKATAIIVTDALDAFWTAKVAAHDAIAAQIAPAVDSGKSVYKHVGTIFGQASAIAVGRIVGFQRIPWA